MNRRGMPSHALMLGVAAALFAAIFALLYVVDDPREAAAVLFVVPIALVALADGRRGGLASAGLAGGLTLVWVLTADVTLGAIGWLARLAAFFLIGALVGFYEDLARSHAHIRLGERYAAELHDRVVQSLVVASYALRANGADPRAQQAVDEALAGAKDIISSRLGTPAPGDLRLEGNASSEAPPLWKRRSL